MAKQVDYDNLSELDFEYIGQRPWLIEEAKQAGYTIDLDQQTCIHKDAEEELLEEEPEEIDASSDDDSEDEDSEEEAIDYSDLSVSELREELKERGLSSEGKKDDLISRLESHDEVE
jgi:U3 small nucleolar ribonucleoprotein component